ncbi:hypothetical protein M413DRAFT_191217 [Hebeloma cylindrosporum]|uniref:Uncharacterized protein n=1 Tax=Hebeloma cylindrosporum TaxID=76867 RepID=A0A0C2YEH4_HEBCY|nr:hypothetical protein M413DRAFT_191217 [Hebeloma cylindrosporum h7]
MRIIVNVDASLIIDQLSRLNAVDRITSTQPGNLVVRSFCYRQRPEYGTTSVFLVHAEPIPWFGWVGHHLFPPFLPFFISGYLFAFCVRLPFFFFSLLPCWFPQIRPFGSLPGCENYHANPADRSRMIQRFRSISWHMWMSHSHGRTK